MFYILDAARHIEIRAKESCAAQGLLVGYYARPVALGVCIRKKLRDAFKCALNPVYAPLRPDGFYLLRGVRINSFAESSALEERLKSYPS